MSRVLAVIIVAVVSLAGACGTDADDGPASPAPTPAPDTSDATSDPASTPVPTDTPGTAQPTSLLADSGDDALFPDVLAAQATQGADGTWDFDVTLSSPYDSAERYADAWRVLDPDGAELGVRELLHDHAGEQPFTRSLSGVEISDDVSAVTIEGRDQVSGWGGATVTIILAR